MSGRPSVLWTQIRTPVSILAVLLTAAAAAAFMTGIVRVAGTPNASGDALPA